MTYAVRDKTGLLKATISNAVARKIIDGVDGEFFKAQGMTCYEIKIDGKSYGIGSGSDEIQLVLWKGDTLNPSLN